MTLAERLETLSFVLNANAADGDDYDDAKACKTAAAILDRLAKWKPEDGYYKIKEMQEEVRRG